MFTWFIVLCLAYALLGLYQLYRSFPPLVRRKTDFSNLNIQTAEERRAYRQIRCLALAHTKLEFPAPGSYGTSYRTGGELPPGTYTDHLRHLWHDYRRQKSHPGYASAYREIRRLK
jgi:hypothetical protein